MCACVQFVHTHNILVSAYSVYILRVFCTVYMTFVVLTLVSILVFGLCHDVNSHRKDACS
jgi:uncharacterized membrane protein